MLCWEPVDSVDICLWYGLYLAFDVLFGVEIVFWVLAEFEAVVVVARGTLCGVGFVVAVWTAKSASSVPDKAALSRG